MASNDQNLDYLRFAFCLLKLLYSLLQKFETVEASNLEELINPISIYLFIGTQYHKIYFGSKIICTDIFSLSDKNFDIQSSLSDFSDADSSSIQKLQKNEEEYMKIRNYACLCLQMLLKASKNKNQNLVLLKSNIFHKEVQKMLESHEGLSILEKMSGSGLLKKKQLHPFFNEPNLVSLLIFEQSAKIRSNLIILIFNILEDIPSKIWSKSFEKQKSEKHSKESFLPISNIIYMAIKNLLQSLFLCLRLEEDPKIMNQLVKLVQSLIAKGYAEKLGFNCILELIEHYL